jgi:hypothetical protein
VSGARRVLSASEWIVNKCEKIFRGGDNAPERFYKLYFIHYDGIYRAFGKRPHAIGDVWKKINPGFYRIGRWKACR